MMLQSPEPRCDTIHVYGLPDVMLLNLSRSTVQSPHQCRACRLGGNTLWCRLRWRCRPGSPLRSFWPRTGGNSYVMRCNRRENVLQTTTTLRSAIAKHMCKTKVLYVRGSHEDPLYYRIHNLVWAPQTKSMCELSLDTSGN